MSSQNSKALAGGIVGAVIGAFVPPLGIGLGFSLGSSLGSYLGAPDGPDVESLRLGEQQIPQQDFGSPLPKVYGRDRVSGRLIWLKGNQIDEREHVTQNEGGKGGPDPGTTTTYSYDATFACAFAQGKVTAIARIWADEVLIYSTHPDSDAFTLLASHDLLESLRIYLGTEDQLPDDLIQADRGIDQTPGYQGVAYVVIEALQLEDFGNRIPVISAEVVTVGTPQVQLTQSLSLADLMPNHNAAFSQWVPGRLVDGELYYYQYSGGRLYSLFPDGTVIKQAATLSPQKNDANGVSDVPYLIRNDGSNRYRLYHVTPNQIEYLFTASHGHIPGNLTASGDYIIHNGFVYTINHRNENPITKRSVNPSETSISSFFPSTLHSASFVAFGVSESRYFFWYNDRQLVITDYNFQEETRFTLSDVFISSRTRLRPLSDTRLIISVSRYVYQVSVVTQQVQSLGQISSAANSSNARVLVQGDLLIATNDTVLEYYNLNAISIEPILLKDLITDLSMQVGLSTEQINMDALEDSLYGLTLSKPTAVRQVIDPLNALYQLDLIETGYQLKGLPQSNAVIAEIPENDLGAHVIQSSQSALLMQRRVSDLELPQGVATHYRDLDRAFEPSIQHWDRPGSKGLQRKSVDSAAVLSHQQALDSAFQILQSAWQNRNVYQLSLSPKYLYLEPGDVITVTENGFLHRMRIQEIIFDNLLLTIKATTAYPVTLKPRLSPEMPESISPQITTTVGPTRYVLLDLPPLRDEDHAAQFYIAASGLLAGWQGATLYRSVDEGANFESWITLLQGATLGQVILGKLNEGPHTILDQGNSLTVKLFHGQLESISDVSFINGGNLCAVGDQDQNNWEILSFKDAILNPDGSYTLSHLMRGQYGTEHQTTTHINDETLVLLNSNLRLSPALISDLNLVRTYKMVSHQRSLQETTEFSFTHTGNSLKPHVVDHVKGVRNTTGDLTLTWIRRNRHDFQWRDGIEAVNSEEMESYEVEILDNNTVVRTFALSTPNLEYSSTQQIADFGSPQSAISMHIYQISAAIGRGQVKEVTL